MKAVVLALVVGCAARGAPVAHREPMPEAGSAEAAVEAVPVDMVHYSEMKVKVRVRPVYPAAAGGRGGHCILCVHVNVKGLPVTVTPRDCPDDVFRKVSIDAAFQYRWYPKMVDGHPTTATFDLHFIYRAAADAASVPAK